MKSIIAVPLENGCLSPHFGHSEQFAIIEADAAGIISEMVIAAPPHQSCLLPGWLAEKGVTDVITSGIGSHALDLLETKKINVYVGVPPKTPAELVTDWLKDELETGSNTCDDYQNE